MKTSRPFKTIVLRRDRLAGARKQLDVHKKKERCTKKRSPAFRRDLPVELSTDAERELPSLTGILLAGILLAGALLLLAGLLLPAALLLAGLLTGILVLLARILILVAHSEFSLCFIRSQDQPACAEMVAEGTAVPEVILRGDGVS